MDFNSHAHVERDKTGVINKNMIANFNSHAHVERDLVYYNMSIPLNISTHTLTWSVTIEEDYE